MLRIVVGDSVGDMYVGAEKKKSEKSGRNGGWGQELMRRVTMLGRRLF